MSYRFGPFLADRASYRLLRDGEPVALTPKLLDLLLFFVEHPGVLVTKEELLDAVWPNANVTDNALARAVSELRDVLGDDATAPVYIRTIARRGYRFVATVSEAEGSAKPSSSPRAAPSAQGSVVSSTDAATIAVPDFSNVTGDAEVNWLSAGAAETVTTDLTRLGAFRVIDRWRVVAAARRSGGELTHLADDLGADLIVAGSLQHVGGRLRMTARLVDMRTGETRAEAKVDGALGDAFALQDGIVRAFVRQLELPGREPQDRRGVRETSSLDAYRAYMEGWLKIESLDTSAIPAAIADFERAVAADMSYAMAYTGLANAKFVAYEMTRVNASPDRAALADGLTHARRAVELDDNLAEAHATLSFLQVPALAFEDARASARKAVDLAPDDWRHWYRLGHALWGQARLDALAYVRATYPQFSYAQFETAMVLVARGEFERVAAMALDGVREQDRQARSGNRFPAVGFHWLSGAIEALHGRHDAAILHYDRECQQVDPHRLYGPEYRAVALTARGHAQLALERTEDALASFREARTFVDGYVRALAGEAVALERLGRRADDLWGRAEAICADLASMGHRPGALLAGAAVAALRGDQAGAIARLVGVLDVGPANYLGWNLPIEPAFARLWTEPAFRALLDRLAERTR